MTDDTTSKLPPLPAMPLPDGTLYGPDRTVRGHPFLPAKVRAYATLYGQLCTDVARASAGQRVAALRAGNTALLEALMTLWSGGGQAAVAQTLRDAGVMNAAGDLDWPALAARKTPPAPEAPGTTS